MWQVSTDNNNWEDITNTYYYSGVTTSDLTICNVDYNLYGTYYRIKGMNNGCPDTWVRSGSFELSFYDIPFIADYAPYDVTACANDNAAYMTVSLVNSNHPSTYVYQWGEIVGGSFQSLSNGTEYNGVTTSKLTIRNVANKNGKYYRVRAFSSDCPDTYTESRAASVWVPVEPDFTNAHPVSRTLCSDEAWTFTSMPANATHYQWLINRADGNGIVVIPEGGQFTGTQTPYLTLNHTNGIDRGTGVNDGWAIWLKAWNGGESDRCPRNGVRSNAAIIRVVEDPAISRQPANHTVCAGNTTYFSIEYTNGTQFQWQWLDGSNGWVDLANGIYSIHDYTEYDGATTDQLTIMNPRPVITDVSYRVKVKNSNRGCPTSWIISDGAKLWVETREPEFTSHPADITVCTDESATFGASADDANMWTWQIFQNGQWVDLTNSNDYDKNVYQNTDQSKMTVSIPAGLNGKEYRVAARMNGCPVTRIYSESAMLTVIPDPQFSRHPQTKTVCYSENSTISFTGVASPAQAYLWQMSEDGTAWYDVTDFDTEFNNHTITYTGRTETTLTFDINGTPSDTFLNGKHFRLLAKNDDCPTTWKMSHSAMLIVPTEPSFSDQPDDLSIQCDVTTGEFTASVETHMPYAYDYKWQKFENGNWTDLAEQSATSYVPGYEGTTTTKLSVTGALYPQSSYTEVYRIGAQYKQCPDSWNFSNEATLSVTPNANFGPSMGAPDATICLEATEANRTITANTYNASSWQWQVNYSGTWFDLTDGLNDHADNNYYSSTSTSALVIGQPSVTMTGSQYRLLIWGSVCSKTITSRTTEITVPAEPVFTLNPQFATVCEYGGWTFTAEADNANEYQWQMSANRGAAYSNIYDNTLYTGTSTTKLEIDLVQNIGGIHYRLLAKNEGCPSSWIASTGASIRITRAPIFTRHPIDVTVCAGFNWTHDAQLVAGTYTDLRWQYSPENSSDWFNVDDNALYNGATTNSLRIATVQNPGLGIDLDGYSYRLRATNGDCPSSYEYSDVALIEVPDIPQFGTGDSPSNATVCIGGTHVFTSSPANTNGYQWQVYNTLQGRWDDIVTGPYTGVNTANLTITNATSLLNNSRYRVVAKNDECYGVASDDAVLTVIANNVSFTQQPSTVSGVCEGYTFSFSGAASNADQYQWQYSTDGSNWNDIAGATNSTYSATALASMNNWYVRLGAKNNVCDVWAYSNTVRLYLNVNPTFSGPSDAVVCDGSQHTFASTVTNATEYQWQVNTGSGWTDIVGAGTPQLVITANTGEDWSYRLQARNTSNCDWVSSPVADLTVVSAPVFGANAHPQSAIVCETDGFTFTSTPANADTYQWQIFSGTWTDLNNSGVYSGVTTNSLVISDVDGLNGNQYRLGAQNSACSSDWTYSDAAQLTVQQTPTVTGASIVDACYGNAVTLTSTHTNATMFGWEVSTDGGSTWTTIGASSDNYTVSSPVDGYRYRITASNQYCSQTAQHVFELNVTQQPVFTQDISPAPTPVICPGSNGDFTIGLQTGTYTEFRWRHSTDGGSNWTTVQTGGTTYSITNAQPSQSGYYKVEARNGSSCPWVSSSVSNLTVPETPSVSIAPANSVLCLNGNMTITASVSPSATEYQWQINNGTWQNLNNSSPYSGVDTQTLTITNMQTTGNYEYRVRVRNSSCAWVESNSANVTVPSQPTFSSHPADATVMSGGHTFTADASNYTALNWQVYNPYDATPSWSNLSNGSNYSGVTTESLAINNVGGLNGRLFRLVAQNNGCPANGLASNSATLTVPSSGPASKLVFTAAIPTQVHSQTFTVTVQVQDNSGNPVNVSANTSVTVTKLSGGGSGYVNGNYVTGTILSGNNQQTITLSYMASNGESNVRLTAMANSLSSATSTAFKVVGPAPTVQASNIQFISVSQSWIWFNWDNGNGSGRLVLAKQTNTNSISQVPENGVDYSANSNFNLGQEVPTSGTGVRAVYNGTADYVVVSGLTKNTRYAFKVLEYNGNATYRSYNTSNATDNPNSQKTAKRDRIEEGPVAGRNDYNDNTILEMSNIMPNPATDKISFHMSLMESRNVSIAVYSADGRLLIDKMNNKPMSAGTHFIEIPFNKYLAPGSYTVMVSVGDEFIIDHFVIAK